MPADENLSLPCPVCKAETQHQIVSEYRRDYSSQDGDITVYHYWKLFQCRGCDYSVTFRHESVCTEDWTGDEPPPHTLLATFPRQPKCLARSLKGIPNSLDRIYKETVEAINAGAFTLAAAGLRALVEGLCMQRGVVNGLNSKGNRVDNLEGKINGLSENGHLTAKHAQTLHQLRFMGNDAVHELDEVPELEALLGLEIIEHMLEGIYSLDEKHAELSALRTHRKKPPSAT